VPWIIASHSAVSFFIKTPTDSTPTNTKIRREDETHISLKIFPKRSKTSLCRGKKKVSFCLKLLETARSLAPPSRRKQTVGRGKRKVKFVDYTHTKGLGIYREDVVFCHWMDGYSSVLAVPSTTTTGFIFTSVKRKKDEKKTVFH